MELLKQGKRIPREYAKAKPELIRRPGGPFSPVKYFALSAVMVLAGLYWMVRKSA
ncbi:TPA: hypothetical protein ACFNMI_002285 [Neisseria bacilliformis]|uniref:Nucleotidyltransferase n=1 Tax=Neisseria bacilliformis ATCC BAA-1200 TaxID=888742 RepID=F2BC28_9NEIS|nr:hypothetical protein [Neisseria bacilliformis]EGF11018.1 nucleotidyltransferase [Neisseria bacilliformis ATCC BAA-1200]QMT48321.1 hypothetical protein H3L91_04180 [Neisseria bacilliformis]